MQRCSHNVLTLFYRPWPWQYHNRSAESGTLSHHTLHKQINICIMVVTRLLEVTTKGSEWVNAQSTTSTTPAPAEFQPISTTGSTAQQPSLSSTSSSYWNYATTALQDMASNAIGSMVSSLYGGGNYSYNTSVNNFKMPQQFPPPPGHESTSGRNTSPTTSYLPSFLHFGFWNPAVNAPPSSLRLTDRPYNMQSDEDGNDYEEDDILYATPRNSSHLQHPATHHPHLQHRRRSSIFAFSSNDSSPWLSNNNSSGKNATPHSDLVWMFRNNKNPYNAVRGREAQLSSLTAVRSLVALVEATTNKKKSTTAMTEESEKSMFDDDHKPVHVSSLESLDVPPPPPYEMLHDDSLVSRNRENFRRLRPSRQNKIGVSTPSETASQLAEGTIRALRDLALEEAVELQAALRYWNYRWERPLLSWLEAGPFGTPQHESLA